MKTLLILLLSFNVHAMDVVCLDGVSYYKEKTSRGFLDQGYGYGYFGVKIDPKTLKPERCGNSKEPIVYRNSEQLEKLLDMGFGTHREFKL